jgi:O-Antigen ligase
VGVVLVAAIKTDRRKAFAVVGALAIGVLLANVAPLPGGSSTERVSGASASGLGPRVALWGNAVTAIGERPFIGFGPGRFATAVSPHTSIEVAQYTGGDMLYADAHNFVVEYATTTGLVGLLLLFGWLVTAGRRARGPLVGFVIAVAMSMLLQPQYVGLTPLVALALGAAGPELRLLPEPGARARSWVAGICFVSAVIGLGFGVVLMAGDAAYLNGVNDHSYSEIARADSLLPPWPTLAAQRSSIAGVDRVLSGERKYEGIAIEAAKEAIRRDPADPQWRFTLGSLEESGLHWRAADRLYRETLARNPWSVVALSGTYRIAVKEDRFADANVTRDQLCRLATQACPPPPAKFARELAKMQSR